MAKKIDDFGLMTSRTTTQAGRPLNVPYVPAKESLTEDDYREINELASTYPNMIDKMLEEAESDYAWLWEDPSSRLCMHYRYTRVPGYEHPQKPHKLFSIIGMGQVQNLLDHSKDASSPPQAAVIELVASWARHGKVVWVMKRDFMEALLRTEVNTKLAYGDYQLPLPSMFIQLPENLIPTPDGGYLNTLLIGRVNVGSQLDVGFYENIMEPLDRPPEYALHDGMLVSCICSLTGMTYGVCIHDSQVEGQEFSVNLADNFVDEFEKEVQVGNHDKATNHAFVVKLAGLAYNLMATINAESDHPWFEPNVEVLRKPKIKNGKVTKPGLLRPRVIGERFRFKHTAAGAEPGTLNREATYTGKEFWVCGHVRRQPYGPRSDPKYKTIWIHPYTKSL